MTAPTPSNTLRVASAQYPFDAPADYFAWEDKLTRWVGEGAATGAQLLVFPEYAAIEMAAIHGPDVTQDLQATLRAVAEDAGRRVALHSDLARTHNVFILVGSGPTQASDGSFFNACQLVGPNGGVGQQAKMIMTPFEHDWGMTGGYEAGEALHVFETPLGRVGVAVCYDSEFPIQVRALAEAGVEVLLVPSCTEHVSGYHRVRDGSRARALENQIAVVTSPTIGDALWSPAVDVNTGASGIFVPPDISLADTGSLAEGTINQPGWVVADIPLSGLKGLREAGEMRNYADWPRQLAGSDVAEPSPRYRATVVKVA